MKKLCSGLLGVIGVALAGSTSHAAVLFSDNFDSYTNGTNLTTNGWTALAGGGNLVTNAGSVSAPNSVESGTSDLRRSEHTFVESGNPSATTNIITFSFDFYDSNSAVSPYRQYALIEDGTAPTSTNQLISIGLNNNQTSANSGGNYYMARILGYDATTLGDADGGPAESVAGSGAFFKLNDFGVGLRSTGWHNLKVIITADGTNTDYAFYVDSVLAERVNNVGTSASIRSYDDVRVGSGLTSGALARFDNISVDASPAPEPGSLAVLGLCGAGILARRRR